MMQSAEPMMMGSPASPTSPGTAMQSPFLPAYLLGDQTPSAGSSQRGLWSGAGAPTSPPKAASNKSGPSPWTSPLAGRSDSSVFQSARSEPRHRDIVVGRGKEKTGAPPVTGLLETLHTSTAHTPEVSRLGHLGTSFTGTPTSLTAYGADPSQFMRTGRKTPPSPAQVDPFYTQGESIGPDDELDETWLTVFGFPPAATSFILQEFSQYGNIIKHVIATDGNWMHLHYQSRLQAKKALSKNSKIFGNSIMVGVTPCIDKAVMMDTHREDNSVLKTSTLALGQSLHPNTTLDSSSVGRYTSVRPLTAAYRAAATDHDVVQKSNTPQKSNGVISKAMDYVFGW